MSETPELKQEMTLNAIPEKKPPKTIEEQLAALEAKKKAIQEREKKLKARQAKKEREARTHRICIIGAAVESAIHRARLESEELSRRERWERTRFLAHCILSPFAKKRMRPTDIIRFDWEKDDPPKATPATRQDIERIRRRYGD